MDARIKRLIIPTVVAVSIGLATLGLWRTLDNGNAGQVARIAEAESYAARSQLVRRIDMMFSAMRNVGNFWARFGHLPQDQWAADADVELDHFDGVSLLLWDNPERNVRYVRTGDQTGLGYRPDDEEWADYQSLREKAKAATATTYEGPLFRDDGSPYYELVFVNSTWGTSGTLAAVLEADQALAAAFMDESPGYAIRVLHADTLLFERGQCNSDVPQDWIRDGLIQSSLGTLWRVEHCPTSELMASFERPSIDIILLLGLMIAVLLGSLTFENDRARRRAIAAETAEKKLADLNRNLEHQIAERTADLQTLTDSVAHDLRNPLNSLSLNLEVLQTQRDQLQSKSVTVIERMASAVAQMAHIVDRLLGLASVTRSALDLQPVDMKALAEKVAKDLKVGEPEAELDLRITDLPTVQADEMLTEMLWLNLLSNAMKFTRSKPSRQIHIECDQSGEIPVFSIRDNGQGFDPQFADRLFKAFDRLDNANSAEGVGLGLTIAARAVERHGGRIWAEGRPDEGATFFFHLGPESTAPA